MHYYNWKPGGYRKHTDHLTDQEDLCYRRLLDWQYENETPIPKETESVIRRLRLVTVGLDSVSKILQEFFELTENGWWNPQAREQIEAFQRRKITNQTNGKQGGRPKKTESVSDGKPNANRRESKSKGNSVTQELNNSTPIVPKGTDESGSELEAIWDAYPKKVGKRGGMASILAALRRSKLPPAEMLGRVQAYATTLEAAGTELRFIKNPTTWFNQDCFNDTLPPPRREGAKNVDFEKNGMLAGAAERGYQLYTPPSGTNPLMYPCCDRWREVWLVMREAEGTADSDFLEELDVLEWRDVPSDVLHAIRAETKRINGLAA